MKDYLDSTWAAADETILNYSGDDVVMQIPSRLGDMEIRAIGDGAFMESVNLLQIALPRRVQRIGKQSFYGCQSLKNIYLPGHIKSISPDAFRNCHSIINLTLDGLPLSEDKYEALKQSCLLAGGIFVARTFPDIPVAKASLEAAGSWPALHLPDGIERLFVSQSLTEDTGRAALTRHLDQFAFDGHAGTVSEEQAFVDLLRRGKRGPREERDTELKNDSFARLEKYPPIVKTGLFTFDDQLTQAHGTTRYITVNIKIGYLFWQSKASVQYGTLTYFVYRRHYLSATEDLSCIRQDVAIFTKSGLVTNKEEAQEVYAKYKLLSIL